MDRQILSTPFCIDNQVVTNRTILAPMAGVTDMPFRILCKRFGCGLTISEMVSAKGLLFNNAKTWELLSAHASEQPYAVQLFGSQPDVMAEAAMMVEARGYKIIDINMGCPVPKVTGAGEGSALMKDSLNAGKIISAMVKAVKVPVTVKFRLGWDTEQINCVEFARECEACGAALITVHGRTREQYYSGRADWNKIADVVRAVNIPVVANGDVFSAQDAENIMRCTGCIAVMVGRGAMGNPWIFRDILHYANTGLLLARPSVNDRVAIICEQLNMLSAQKGELRAVKEMRSHAAWYTKGLYNSSELRERFNRVTSADSFIELFEEYKEKCHEREELC